jgi:hypothetical protein
MGDELTVSDRLNPVQRASDPACKNSFFAAEAKVNSATAVAEMALYDLGKFSTSFYGLKFSYRNLLTTIYLDEVTSLLLFLLKTILACFDS